jgi:lipoprotein-anchoring transpeptidase ErfK/SrfK
LNPPVWLNGRVPVLKKSAAKGSRRAGDFLAVLLLLGILAGLGWLWWQQKHPKKPVKSPLPVRVVEPPRPQPTPTTVVPATPAVAKHVELPAPLTNSTPIPAPPEPKPKVVSPVGPVPVPSPPPPIPSPVSPPVETARPVRTVLEAQIALVRLAISPGPIDGAKGSQTRAALAAFQRAEGLPETGLLDTNTRPGLTLEDPVLTDYTVTPEDLARLQPLGKTWLAKSEQSALDYETILELVAEKAHAHPAQIQKLNPGVNWTNVVAGVTLKIPDVNYPEPDGKAAFVVIHLAEKFLEAFDAETNLLLHCPCSIAARVEKRPVGELHVAVIAPHPNYTFDPAVFPESPEAQAIGHKLVLPPGPNNPVGVAWIGLDKPGYGIHGTPVPEQVGRTESHGCFRLANWDAEYFLKLVWVGLPVQVVP